MTASPWIKFYTSDFLNGVGDLSAEEIGVYTIICALIWDKGTPLEDDRAWLARRAGASTKKINIIMRRLIDLGKLEVRNGMIGQRRALEEVARRDKKSEQAQSAAFARWHNESDPQLDLENSDADLGVEQKLSESSADLQRFKNVLKSPKKQPNSQNTAKNDDADAFFPSRARAFQSPETRITTNQTAARAPEHARDSTKPDKSQASLIHARFIAVSHASGHHPRTDEAIAAAKGFIARWTDLDIDFDSVAIPAIIEFMSKTDDPMTSSLARFDRIITAKAAKARAKPANANATPPPIFDFDDEPPIAQKLRKRLAHALGPARYFYLCMPNTAIPKPITLRTGEHGSGVGAIIAIDGPMASRLKDEVSHNQWRKFAQELDLVDIF